MIFETSTALSTTSAGFEDLAAIITLILMGCLVYTISHSKPTTQRALLRIMFQPMRAIPIFASLWLVVRMLSLTLLY